MATSFLLRFQEPCDESGDELLIRCATQTETKTNGEQGDRDPGQQGYRALPAGPGNRVKMAAGQERPAIEAGGCPVADAEIERRIVAMATQTITRIRGEVDDEDPSRGRWLAIPRQP